jgi:hypothetical protein
MSIQTESSQQSKEVYINLRNRALDILTQIDDRREDCRKTKALRGEYNAIVERIQRLKRPCNSFQKLPTELIVLIFSECALLSGDVLCILSLVCTEWQELVIQSAELWTQISVNFNEPDWQENIEMFHMLSRERLLSITLSFPFPNDQLGAIAKESHRWESLTVIEGRTSVEKDRWRFPLRPTDSNALLQLLQDQPLPNLKGLDIQVKLTNTFSPYLWSNIFADSEAFESIPQRPFLLSHLTVNLFFVDFEDLVIKLAELPDLAFLKLSAQRRAQPNLTPDFDGPKLPLNRLTELILEEPGSAGMLLQRISCPNLSSMKAHFDLVDYISQVATIESIPSLKTLKVSLFHSGGHPPITSTPKFKALDLYDFTYLDDRRPKGASEERYNRFIAVSDLVACARRVSLAMASSFSEWWRTLGRIIMAEEILIDGGRNYSEVTLEHRPDDPRVLPNLRLLHVKGDSIPSILLITRAPALQELLLSNANAPLNDVLSFISHSPNLKKLELRAIRSSDQKLSIETPIMTCLEDVLITHDCIYILQYLELPKLKVFRMMGVLQGVSIKRDIYHFDRREIHVDSVLYSLPILSIITELDLCVVDSLFPVVCGLDEALPEMKMVEKIRLPRALRKGTVWIDKLIDSMLAGSCPRLGEIYSEDYPPWGRLMELLVARNRLQGLELNMGAESQPESEGGMPRPIQTLYLPGLPHRLILDQIQILLAGKIPMKGEYYLAAIFV